MLKERTVKYIFFVMLSAAIVFPTINIYFVYPLFTGLLVENTEEEALRTAKHLESVLISNNSELTRHAITHDFVDRVNSLKRDFKFTKLKTFSKAGEIVFSTSSEDIGTMNDKDYFQKVVAKGNIYTKVVKKDMKSLEDQAVTADVVETYIPIMRGDTFLGAFEIYYDITQRNKKLDIVKFYSSSMALVMMCIFLGVIVVSLLKLDRNIIKRRQTEEKLKVFASKLEKSNQNLEEFAYIASHDLQEPLRKVVTFGDQLKKKYHEVLGEQGNDYLDRMQNATRRMQTFINDLLAISRVTTQAQSFASVDLGKVAKEVISDLEVRIQQTGGRVEIGELPAIEADALQMRQLLQNLIVNALKFHKKDEPPVVRVSGTLIRNNGANAERNVSHDESCQVTFEDNGIGFDEKYADRIFGVFQRLHGRNQYEGSGIGLSICKKIVERHGGTITAKSAPGKGTTFIITLPAKHKGEE